MQNGFRGFSYFCHEAAKIKILEKTQWNRRRSFLYFHFIFSLFFPCVHLQCTFSRYANNYRYIIPYEINAQWWRRDLVQKGLEEGGGGGGGHFKNRYCQGGGGVQFSYVIILGRGVNFWYITLFWKPPLDWFGQKFLNNLACEFAVHFSCRNAEMNLISTNRFKSFKQAESIFIYL